MRNTKLPHSGSKLACVAGAKRRGGGQGEGEGEKRERGNSPPFSSTFPQSLVPFDACYAG